MPELANRTDREDEMRASIAAVLAMYQREYMKTGSVDWDQFERDLQSAMRPTLEAVFVESYERMQQEHAITISAAILLSMATSWATRYAAALAEEIRQTTEVVIRSVSDRAAQISQEIAESAGSTPTEIATQEASEVAFSRQRAESISVTETTRANSAGETAARNTARESSGIELQAVWITERDDKVCPICSPLNNKRERFWIEQFPMGPPAHPRCRCHVEYIEVLQGRPRSMSNYLEGKVLSNIQLFS